jgi:hypothetical protein
MARDLAVLQDDASLMAGAIRIALMRLEHDYVEEHGKQAWIDNAWDNLNHLEEIAHANLVLAFKLCAELEVTVVE